MMESDVGNFVAELGPFPLLQIFGGLAVLGLGILAWLRGSQHHHTDIDFETILRLDGPIAQVLRRLEQIAENSRVSAEQLRYIAGEQKDQRRTLQEIKEAMERGWPPPRR